MVGLVGNAPTTFPISRERSTSDLKAQGVNIKLTSIDYILKLFFL